MKRDRDHAAPLHASVVAGGGDPGIVMTLRQTTGVSAPGYN
jgi:hypothetical protein